MLWCSNLAQFAANPVDDPFERPAAPSSSYFVESVRLKLIVRWILHVPQEFIAFLRLETQDSRKVLQAGESEKPVLLGRDQHPGLANQGDLAWHVFL